MRIVTEDHGTSALVYEETNPSLESILAAAETVSHTARIYGVAAQIVMTSQQATEHGDALRNRNWIVTGSRTVPSKDGMLLLVTWSNNQGYGVHIPCLGWTSG